GEWGRGGGTGAGGLARVAGSKGARCGEKLMGMRSSLIVRLLGRSVRQVVPQAQSESEIGGDADAGSHAAVDVGSIAAHGREFGEAGMVGGEGTHRIGCGGGAGGPGGLAAAAARNEAPPRAARATRPPSSAGRGGG